MTAKQLNDFLESDGNFLYLQHTSSSNRSAYDLEIVDHSATKAAEYYTLSRAGITHFHGVDSEFTPLDQWEREYSLFNKMRDIPFFSKYRSWKSFTVWKSNVKGQHLAAARDALSSNLFIFIPALRDALMTIKNLCAEVNKLRLIEVKTERTQTLAEFVESQKHLQSNLTEELSNFSIKIHNSVRSACDEIVDEFLKANTIVADHKMTFMERASLRSECRKLTKFLKLTDFLVVDTLHDMALESVSSAVASMAGPPIVDPKIFLSKVGKD
jgi:dynein heavy chain